MGVAPDTSEKVSTVPPINVGGNLDINELGVGATLYLPVEVGELNSTQVTHILYKVTAKLHLRLLKAHYVEQ